MNRYKFILSLPGQKWLLLNIPALGWTTTLMIELIWKFEILLRLALSQCPFFTNVIILLSLAET